VLDLIDELHRDGMTLLVVTHDASVAAPEQRTVVIRDGLLHESDRSGSAEQVERATIGTAG